MLIKKGSVKDIYKESENMWFEYSDRYSIYDWGEMPNLIENKGFALLLMAEYFFNKLEKENIKTHFIKRENNRLYVREFEIPNIINESSQYDYSHYQTRPKNTLIPLECIFRFGVPKGSSLLKRINSDQYRKTLGLTQIPKEGDIFDDPIIEFSTKLESTDRYITYQEAKEISGMNDNEFSSFKKTVFHSAVILKKLMTQASLTLWDGKFEYAFDEKRNFVMIDSIGPDELRITLEGTQLSKENLRAFYHNSKWQKDVEKAKDLSHIRGVNNWKEICINELNSIPYSLGRIQLENASSLYTTLTNHLYEGDELPAPFKENKNINEVISYFRKLA